MTRLLTTPDAAAYCSITPSGLRKAAARGEVRSAGRRGGRGVRMWDPAELDRYLAAETPKRSALDPAPPAQFSEIGPPRSYGSTVYFVQSGLSGPVKIGVTEDLPSRLKSLQTASPYPVRLIAYAEGDHRLESAYHRRFAAHRLAGEWFGLAAEICLEIDSLRRGTTEVCLERIATLAKGVP